jgi:hypothetical protein
MNVSFELLLNWGSKVMKSDEGFSNMLDKQMLIQLVNGNVIVPTQNKIQKGEFLLAFFMPVVKICSEVCSEGAVKFLRRLSLFKTSQKYYLRK